MPAEGKRKGGEGGLESGTDKKRRRRACREGKRHHDTTLRACIDRNHISASLALSRTRAKTDAELRTPSYDGEGSTPRRAEVEQRAGGAQEGGQGLCVWGRSTRTTCATACFFFPGLRDWVHAHRSSFETAKHKTRPHRKTNKGGARARTQEATRLYVVRRCRDLSAYLG